VFSRAVQVTCISTSEEKGDLFQRKYFKLLRIKYLKYVFLLFFLKESIETKMISENLLISKRNFYASVFHVCSHIHCVTSVKSLVLPKTSD